MNKNCKECNSNFVATNTKGSEQIYCSKNCRNKAAAKRFQLNLIAKHNDKNNEERSPEFNETNERNNGRNLSVVGTFKQETNSKTYDNDIITSIRETYEERSKVLFYQLKCEQLEKEVQQLKQDIINLEMELEECNETEEESNDIISGIVSSFKTDPQTTISFATELITNFIKPKKTA
jgi:hypothetical protein